MNRYSLAHEFIGQTTTRLHENTAKIEKCLLLLNEEEIWKRPNPSSNSIGNLVLHLCGNITQYIIASLGEKDDNRNRDLEFSMEGGYTKKELSDKLHSTVHQAVSVLKLLKEQDLIRIRSVQGFEYSGMASIIHVVEHYSYHTGQIAYRTKMLKDQDLGFYAGIDLNRKNK